MNNDDMNDMINAAMKLLDKVQRPHLQGDGLDDLRLNSYAGSMCLALGLGYSPQAASVIETNIVLAKFIGDSKG